MNSGRYFPVWAAVALASVQQSVAQDWVTSGAPQAQWMSIASSADGRKLIAASEDAKVFTSINGGTNWTPSPAPYIGQLASSADGTKLLIAPANRGLFYLSTNSGATWTPSIVPTNFWRVASSADGTKLIAVGGGGVLSSSDSGATWTNYANLPFSYVASSADGTKLSAIARGGGPGGAVVHTSTNSGATWRPTGLALDNAFGLACSADGNKLAAVHWEYAFGGPSAIFVSTNFGGTWTRTSAPRDAYNSIASSADGTTLVSPATPVWLSTNSGAAWNQIGATNICQDFCAISADGKRITIASGPNCPGPILFRQAPPVLPRLNLRSSGSDLTLSWLVPSVPFVLQTRPNLMTSGWTNVVVTPTLNCTNLHYEITLPATEQAMFYRLSLQ